MIQLALALAGWLAVCWLLSGRFYVTPWEWPQDAFDREQTPTDFWGPFKEL